MDALITSIVGLPLILQGLLVILCLLGLWIGSDKVIWSVQNLAREWGISELVIGLTVVSIGSSIPEIFVNISAGLEGRSDIGVGNIIGSCLVQISFILGLCVLIAGEMKESRSSIIRDGAMLLGGILFLWFNARDGIISFGEGALMMGLYFSFVFYLLGRGRQSVIHQEKSFVAKLKNFKDKIFGKIKKETFQKPKTPTKEKLKWVFVFLLGLLVVWLSAEVLLGIGISAGEEIGLTDAVLGLISGIGTTIPEFVISVAALIRKSGGISVGNLIGSNITDPLFSLSVGVLISGGYTVSSDLLWQGIPALLGISTVVCFLFFWREKIGRAEGLLLMGSYIGIFFWLL